MHWRPASEVARDWVKVSCENKGLPFDAPASGEEWLGGPLVTMRNLRLTAEQLEAIARTGKPAIDPSKIKRGRNGRAEVEVFPTTAIEKALYGGLTATVRMEQGMGTDEVRARMGSFYSKKDPEGGVCLILGAGNVASIPPMDAIYKLFTEGEVCVVKLNPVNEYLAPIFDRAFAPMIAKGWLAFIRGGAEVGKHLVEHASISSIHITGSDRTHDAIVWGADPEEQKRRKAADDPKLTKPISSELGCVTPVIIVPGPYSDAELAQMSEYIATMVVNNASCNCNAGKMLVTQKGWGPRDALLARVRSVLASQKPRKAYYPGAFDRYEKLVGSREGVEKLGAAAEGELPWTLVTGLDASDKSETLFTTEPFCPILSEAQIDEADTAAFLRKATAFCNDTLWGTLSGVVFIHPRTEADPDAGAAFNEMLDQLRYGAVGVNQWTGMVYGLVTTPWGAHPSSTLKDIQGGLGWVHNTFMLEGIEKVILRGPLTQFPKPPLFVTAKKTHEMGPKLVELERDPGLLKVPGIALLALQG
ncbi:MAG: aldehyde dehydrogenase family protein [Polyangiales bacterium]